MTHFRLQDFEREMMQEKIRLEEDSRARGAWNEVEIGELSHFFSTVG